MKGTGSGKWSEAVLDGQRPPMVSLESILVVTVHGDYCGIEHYISLYFHQSIPACCWIKGIHVFMALLCVCVMVLNCCSRQYFVVVFWWWFFV